MPNQELFIEQFPVIQSRLNETYGNQQGGEIYAAAKERIKLLAGQVDDFGNAMIRKHYDTNMLPVIALYQCAVESGVPAASAKQTVGEILFSIADELAAPMEKMGRMPFAYAIYRASAGTVLSKGFPAEGWDMEVVQRDKKGLAFNCTRCIYVETTNALGCPELCELFCQTDDIKFAKLAPKIIFKRTQTLATGGTCCDFQLLNGHYLSKASKP